MYRMSVLQHTHVNVQVLNLVWYARVRVPERIDIVLYAMSAAIISLDLGPPRLVDDAAAFSR
eukprot:SAG31_NODE_972_length_10644_cov_3.435372_4_plen_62_part_00